MIPKTIIIKIVNGSQRKHYQGLGYEFDIGNEYEIPTSDFPKGSHIKIPCTCDYCGNVKMKPYKDYLESLSSQGLYACKDCKRIKTRITNMEKYGFPSPSCTDEVKERIAKTCMERYGTKSTVESDIVKAKIKESIKSKYGIDHYSQTEEYKEKFKNTMNQRYGVSHAAHLPEFREKMSNTLYVKCGYYNPQQCPSIREKTINTVRSRYGVNFPSQRKEFKEILHKNCTKKYGVESPAQLPEVRRKAAITLSLNQAVTTSKQQLYIHNLYGGELNGVVSHFNCDIVFRDEKLICEVDLGGHDLCVKLGDMTEEEFKRKEIIRSNYIKREGFRIIRIISRKDYLPSDEVLLSMLQFARQFFIDNPQRSWLNFDIDNSCIYNAYHKESSSGLPYDFGPLRKIKKSDIIPLPDHKENQIYAAI